MGRRGSKIKVAMRLSLTILSFLIISPLFSQETVPMKDYVDVKTDLNRQLAEAQFKNISDNITKATVSMDKRLDGMNEFRDTLKDQAGTFITRSELFTSLLALFMAFMAFSNYKANQVKKNQGENIVSGDKVEVKK